MYFYRIHSTVGTVGPYTISISYCHNGVIFGITTNEHTAHQSLPADICIRGEEQVVLSASEILAAEHQHVLYADEALRGTHTIPTDADMALRGDVRISSWRPWPSRTRSRRLCRPTSSWQKLEP